jgi:hypothetical protein
MPYRERPLYVAFRALASIAPRKSDGGSDLGCGARRFNARLPVAHQEPVMHAFRLALPVATALLAVAALAVPQAARAQTPLDSPILGAWGSDSGCAADVVVFRADGTVVDTGAVAGTPRTTYSLSGDAITLTQGDKTGQFALALTDQAVAWSNGVSIVLKERCADQGQFASDVGAASAPVSLYDQIRALAAKPLDFNGIAIKVAEVEGHTALAPSANGTLYSEVIAHPDAGKVGAGAALLYRIFPTPAAAAAHVSLRADMRSSFIYEHRGAGYFATATATDEGNTGSAARPVTIDCLRFHPKGTDRVQISCFAQMPGSRLVAGGRQSFPLPAGAKPRDMGSKSDLSETLDLTSLAIDTLRGFLADGSGP